MSALCDKSGPDWVCFRDLGHSGDCARSKKRGRPRLGAGKRRRHQIYLSDADWHRAVEALEQGTGCSGDTPGQIVAEALRRLASGGWRPIRVQGADALEN